MKLWIASAVAVLPMVAAVHQADAAPGASAAPASPEIARLEAEIKEERDILLQSIQIEQQHYDLLLKLIQNVSQGGVANPRAGGELGASGAGALLIPPMNAQSAAPEPPARKTPERTATVTGKIVAPGGAADVYVYVQNVHGGAAHGRTVEIAQRDKQFVPSVAVVQRGTRVSFPNFDAVYHNVFSPGPPHAFDLGSYRAGDAPRAIEMTSPGVVELFCNMHSKMHASVLVVPNALWTRVAADGSFRIENVPVGARKLVAWSPKTRPADQTVEVGAAGASVSFTLGAEGERPHNNKYGMPYGSYKE
jgi:plastocyanin